MQILDSERSAVVLIDMQGKLMEMVDRSEQVRSAARRLLSLADLFEVPVVMTEQYPAGLGPTHPEIATRFEELSTQKRLVEKDTFSCCDEAGFEEALRAVRPGLVPGERQLIVGGIEAHICVVQSVLGLLEGGNRVYVCWECVSGRGAEYRHWALERMQQAGATITNHESVGFEWAGDKNHPRFKALSALLKEGQV